MAEVTVTGPYESYQGNPLRVIPIRNTTSSGQAEDVDSKEGLRHIVLRIYVATTGDSYIYGRPVRSAAFHSADGNTSDVEWDPSDELGSITIAIGPKGSGYGWLHIWSYD